ncbi:MAG: hypothetical protein SGI74_06720, partial [Oligoflexia bacterium]|nr:hypothetical protein [Oligoflexia bacterium]
SRYSYENPDLFPDIDSEADTLSEVTLAPLAVPQENPIIAESNGMVVASNVGTAIYLTGKQRRALIGYSFKTANNAVVLPITTPRAGLMMIGRGLFMIKINQTNPKSLADTILRTSVLLHEARHSDGNGKSLGFGHALCPQGHSYFGQGYACDRNINGPYNVEAAYLKQTRSDCVLNKTCTAEEAEGLALMAEDAYSRVISQRVLDARPEGH